MQKHILSVVIISAFSIITGIAQTKAPTAFGPVPSENQMKWQNMESYAFVHFSLNTYTDQSWGFGNEDVKLFNPQQADCRQWARICKEDGLILGIYLSPCDRNSADYEKPEYISFFRNQLTGLLTNYGPVFEVWF